MSTPPALGTFIIYGISAVCSSSSVSYRFIFLMPAFILFFTGVVWFVLTRIIILPSPAQRNETGNVITAGRKNYSKAVITSFVLLALVAISNGFIKDGTTTWMPSLLKESYGMKESISIILTVILPLIAVFGAGFSALLHKREKNTSLINFRLFFIETVFLAVLLIVSLYFDLKSPVLLICIFAVSAVLMSAVNNVITSIIPMFIKKKSDSGLLAGALDTFCYIGSMLSSVLLGFISDRKGWTGVFVCFLIFAFIACLISRISLLLSKKEEESI